MRATLPLPPTVNHYWLPKRGGGKYLSPAAVAFKTAVAHMLAGVVPITGPVRIEWWAFRPRDAGDVDNFNKGLLDGLKGRAYLDDRQVKDLLCHNRTDAKNPRLEVVWESAQAQPQVPLFDVNEVPDGRPVVVNIDGKRINVPSDRLRPAVIRPGDRR